MRIQFEKWSTLLLALLMPLAAPAQTLSGAVTVVGAGRQGEPPLISPTPQMGWNSYIYLFETYGTPPATGASPTAAFIEAQADALVSTGLASLGYTLDSVDWGWDQRTSGVLEAIPANFPSGMASVATHLHAEGIQLGLYVTPGSPCLSGGPSSYGYEQADAATMAGWGVDYVKSDACSMQTQFPSDLQQENAFKLMANSLVATDRNVGFLVNAYYTSSYATNTSGVWFRDIGATDVRIGNDNTATYANFWWYYKPVSLNWTPLKALQSKGHWLDPDNLVMQLYEYGPGLSGLTQLVGDAEGRAQFEWYTILAAPLVFGEPVASLDANNLVTLSNVAAIAVDQDPNGVMGSLIASTTCGSTVCQVWSRTLSTGKIAVVFLNFDTTASHTVPVTWTQLGISGSHSIFDIYANASEGSSSSGYTSVTLAPFQTTTAGQWCSQMVIIQ